MLRPLALAAAALLTLTACGADSEAPTTAPTVAPFSLSVGTTSVSRSSSLTVTLRNDSGRSVESGTFCVDGGFERQVGNSWEPLVRSEVRACTLPALLWSVGQSRTEIVPMDEWSATLSGTGPWTVRATYRVLDGTTTTVLRSAPITIVP
ncbi:MAG: hypothetical protein MUF40_00445 [Gemmatimonadaceae bacterium]|jgi:hypothetical protein|nr:hypothetical protein [Gemmatimonadaceae bacterium]